MAYTQVARRLDEELRSEHGLSLQEYGALVHLVEAPGRRLRMGRLAEALLLSKSGVTRLVDRLVEDGLVARSSCSSDARGAEATLTDAGVDRLRGASPTHLRGISSFFLDAIPPDDLAAVQRAMQLVAEHAALAGSPCAAADEPADDAADEPADALG
ncbi:MAG: MarR family transcriptional regulator [Anaerolinea sp.]|nr:MarR family transcriptional regulator [Anaerolinea sp.]